MTQGMPTATWPSAAAETQPSATAPTPTWPQKSRLRLLSEPLVLNSSTAASASLRHRAELHGIAAWITSASGALIAAGCRASSPRRNSRRPESRDRVACQRVARHAADRQLVGGCRGFTPGQHLHDAHDRSVRAGREIISPQRIQKILTAGESERRIQFLFLLGKRILGEHAAHFSSIPGVASSSGMAVQGWQRSGEIACRSSPRRPGIFGATRRNRFPQSGNPE